MLNFLIRPKLSSPTSCPYLDHRSSQNEYFLANNLTKEELEYFLSTGWRKFGLYFFRPKCQGCQACSPIRVLTQRFTPTKSQRRTLNKNKDLEVVVRPPQFRQEIYEIYQKHSWERFQQKTDPKEFYHTHFQPSCPGFQSEYYLNKKLIAVGFLDVSHLSLSSIYFIFDPEYSNRGLGNFGSLFEILYASKIGLPYYYLGYYIEDNPSMAYKLNFRPHEIYHWREETWSSRIWL